MYGIHVNNFTGVIFLKNRAFPDCASVTIGLLKSMSRGNYQIELGLDSQPNNTSHRHHGTISLRDISIIVFASLINLLEIYCTNTVHTPCSFVGLGVIHVGLGETEWREGRSVER